MKVDTLLKLGSLAVNVAQDEKVRELLNMVHQGAKRRGLIPAPPAAGHPRPQKDTASPPASAQAHAGAQSHPPAAGTQAKTPAAPAQPFIPFGPWTGLPPQAQAPMPVGSIINRQKAKKAAEWLRIASQLLIK